MHKKGSILSFNNYVRSMKVSLVVYADFETMLKPIDTCRLNHKMSFTKQYQKHVPVRLRYYIKCFDDNINFQKPVT